MGPIHKLLVSYGLPIVADWSKWVIWHSRIRYGGTRLMPEIYQIYSVSGDERIIVTFNDRRDINEVSWETIGQEEYFYAVVYFETPVRWEGYDGFSIVYELDLDEVECMIEEGLDRIMASLDPM